MSKRLERLSGYFPSRKQWQHWSLPSRLTAIGAYTGIAALVVTVYLILDNNSDNPSSEPIREEPAAVFEESAALFVDAVGPPKVTALDTMQLAIDVAYAAGAPVPLTDLEVRFAILLNERPVPVSNLSRYARGLTPPSIGALDPRSELTRYSVSLVPLQLGVYEVVMSVKGRLPDGDSLIGMDTVTFVVQSPPTELLLQNDYRELGIFRINDPVYAPPTIEDLRKHTVVRVIHALEAERTNLLKASVWLAQDYLGACGGSFIQVSYSPSGAEFVSEIPMLQTLISDSAMSYSHLMEAFLTGRARRFLPTDECFPRKGPVILPIGANYYRLAFDSDTLRTELVRMRCESIGVALDSIFDDAGYQRSRWWSIEDSRVNLHVSYSVGATGRGGGTSVTIGGVEYLKWWSTDGLSGEQLDEGDFPILAGFSRELNGWLRVDVGFYGGGPTVHRCALPNGR